MLATWKMENGQTQVGTDTLFMSHDVSSQKWPSLVRSALFEERALSTRLTDQARASGQSSLCHTGVPGGPGPADKPPPRALVKDPFPATVVPAGIA
jgi:hypothetical protein